jgi:cyclase
LGIPEGRVVKGVKFKEIKYAGVPWELAEKYYREGADEIAFLDITASAERRETMVHVVERTSERVFVPLTVGGGIRSLDDFGKMFRAGADKCSINTAAIKNPELITEAAGKYGSQAVVVAIDAIKKGDGWECSMYGGREFTGKDAIKWAKECEAHGAGEILLTSMDADGTRRGYDTELTRKVVEELNIPVIASGGAGTAEDIARIFRETGCSAALAASIFHFGTYTVKELKKELRKKGIRVRL